MFKKKLIRFTIIILLLINIPFIESATNEGYGEDQDALGQFTDSFENSDNITVIENLIRNATIEAIELNYTSGVSYDDYTYNIMITIESDRIGSNLTNFPVLIVISDNAGISNDNITGVFDEVGNSYQKIAITDSSLTNEYYVEVEQWSLTDRLGALWISVNVSSIEDIILYLHFDGSKSNNTAYIDLSGSVIAQNIWDDNFIMVQHMADATSSTVLDSTQYNYDGIKEGANEPNEFNSITGLGQDFDGSDDYIQYDGWTGVTFWNATSEMIFKPDILVKEIIVSYRDEGGTYDSIRTYIVNNQLYAYWRTDGVTCAVSVGYTNTVNYDYFVMTKEGTATKAFMNGTYDNRWDDITGGGAIDGISDLTSVQHGAYGLEHADTGNMKLIEARVSDITRSDEWINATYYACYDMLIEFGLILGAEGYEINGYFITEDYLNYTTGSSLAYLTNTSIPEFTEMTIQFSNDNITWVDNEGNVGSNILDDGFYALDLRDLNYTDIYSMFNFSTSNNLYTPILYQSRLITTFGIGGDISEGALEDYAGLFIVGLIIGLILGIGSSRL